MNKNFFIFLGCFLIINVNIKAGDLSQGVDLFEAGMYQAAQRYFKTQSPSGESNYYLGEIAYACGKIDSASIYYDRGLATEQPYALCYVGKGKLMLRSNVKEAEAIMQKAFVDRASKKDPVIYTAIGNAYIANKMSNKAKEYFDQAHNLDKNYAGIYIAEGDILMAEKKISDAANKYDMAAYLDKKNKSSRLKLAEIYANVNPEQAVNTINELLAIDNTYAPAYKQLGELYYAKSQMEKAGEAYSRYLSFGYGDAADYARYASILFFNKDYRGSLAEVEKAMAKDPSNSVMKRLLGYNLFEIEEHERALTAMTSFMNDPKSNQIATDYKYYARILRKNKLDSLSIDYYTKAMETDPTNKNEILKEMGQTCESMKKYGMAGGYYEQYLENTSDAGSTDYFYCGRCYYYAGGRMEVASDVDSVEQTRLFQKADQKFAEVAERSSSSYLGNFWRARVQASLDPETTQGLAKPYYEQALTILETNPTKYSSELQECYKYLGYYYYQQDDKETSISYWNKVLAIAPNDKVATEALKGLTKKDLSHK